MGSNPKPASCRQSPPDIQRNGQFPPHHGAAMVSGHKERSTPCSKMQSLNDSELAQFGKEAGLALDTARVRVKEKLKPSAEVHCYEDWEYRHRA